MIKKYIITILIFIISYSCTSKTEKKVINKELDDKITTTEEKTFFNQNKIPKNSDGFYGVFFSYLNGNPEKFSDLSEKFMKSENSPKILKTWIALKYFNLFRNDEISFKKLRKFYLENQEIEVSKLLEKEAEILYSDWFKLKEKSKLKNLNKWYISGPYKKIDTVNLNESLKHKAKNLFKEKYINFKKGGIIIPEEFNYISGNPFKLTSYFKTENNTLTLYLINSSFLKLIKIDGKTIYKNDDLYKFTKKDILKINLEKGLHEITLLITASNSEIYVYTDQNIEILKNSNKIKSDKIKSENLIRKLEKSVYSLKNNYSNSFKSIIMADIISDLTNNPEYFYKYIKRIKHNNFYKDYLYFRFYENLTGITPGIRNKYMQKYLKATLEKNPDFHFAKYEYTILKNNPNSYKTIDSLKKLPQMLKYLKTKALYQLKANLLNEYLETVNEIYSKSNGKIFIYKYLCNENLKKYNINTCKTVLNELKDDLIYKNNPTNKDYNYILNLIKNNPYSPYSEYMIEYLEKANIKLNDDIVKNFKNKYTETKLKKIKKNLKDFIKNNKKYYPKADLFLNKINRFVNYQNTQKIIKNFEKRHEDKSGFPITKLLDYDIVFIEKDYFILLNRRIFKVNNSEGLRRYSNMPRDNYIKLVTISKETLEEFPPLNNLNTSEISLKTIKIGDYIEAITYDIKKFNTLDNIYDLVSFRYKDFNQDVIKAKLDIYITKYFNSKTENIHLLPTNKFNAEKIKKSETKNYILYKYEENNLKGVKPEPFSPPASYIFPTLRIVFEKNWNDIFNTIKLFNDFLVYSDFSNDIVKNYGSIKSLEDLKNLYYSINGSFKHLNSYYLLLFDLNYLNKRGNLAFFTKMILDKKGIKNSVLVFHDKYNFVTNENYPSMYYYNYYILEVKFKDKKYYMDFSNEWNTFNTINPSLYNQPYIRINNQGIKREIFNNFKKQKTKTEVFVKINESSTADFNIKMTVPSYISYYLKAFLTSQSKSRIKMIFYSIFSKKFQGIKNFTINFENENKKDLPLVLYINFTKKYIKNKNSEISLEDLLSVPYSKGIYTYKTLKDYTFMQQRTLPLITPYVNDVLKISVEFPENHEIKKIKNQKISNKLLDYSLVSKSNKNKARYTIKLYLKTVKTSVKDYKNLKDTVTKIIESKNQYVKAVKK